MMEEQGQYMNKTYLQLSVYKTPWFLKESSSNVLNSGNTDSISELLLHKQTTSKMTGIISL
jgi:hypothetical protein